MSDSLNCALGCVGTCQSKGEKALCGNVSCDLGGVVSGTLLPSKMHFLYWGNVLEFIVGSSVSELGIWQFLNS